MSGTTEERSFLYKMKICNFGCFGPQGAEIVLDQIVALVGTNNSGKTTVLRAYEAAANNESIQLDEIFSKDPKRYPDFVKSPPTVELWVHIPEGAQNIDAKWKEFKDGMLLVRSKWTWDLKDGNAEIRASVRNVLDDLCGTPGANDSEHPDDGRHYETLLRRWIEAGAIDDPAYSFD